MSELIIERETTVRWKLLATVSAMAICGASCAAPAFAGDADRSTVWIELGAQLERTQGGQDPFLPPFLQSDPRPGFEEVSPASTQRPPRYAVGGEGKVTFAPEGSDWSFSVGVRYGRSNGAKHLHQQTTVYRSTGVNLVGTQTMHVHETAFGDTASAHRSSHLVADFTAGRDVGLGLWRDKSAAMIDFGVRFAQFTARSTTTLRELPDPFFERVPQPPTPFFPNWHKYKTYTHHHSFYAQSSIWRSFSGVGPTISMSGSQAFAGNPDDGEISFDWGANGAVLFGRQKVRGSHKTTGEYFTNHFTAFGFPPKTTYSTPKPVTRTQSVVVPNVGGFAGLSVRRANAKVSFGYRADFFFGAMDAGIDARHTEDMSFHGPFAKISVGL
jgi:hypothetical protein